MRRKLSCAAAVLSLFLSVPVFAGDIQTPTFCSTPPTIKPNADSGGVSGPGDASSPDPSQKEDETASDILIDVILDFLTLY
jgi:hypothetical protein